jgi:O-acetyl-ADP-ribose deacetylase (regulator of RNase III)
MEEVKGNLIKMAKEGKFDLIIQGCNCQKKWGAGLALSMSEELPLAYQADLEYNTPKLNEYSVSNDYNFTVINAYTQVYPGAPYFANDTKEKRMESIKNIFIDLNEKYKGKHIGLPLIGCGYGGLDWKEVKQLIQIYLSDMKVTVVHFDGN